MEADRREGGITEGTSLTTSCEDNLVKLHICNGIEDKGRDEQVQRLEMFHYNFPTMEGLSSFSGVKELTIVAQDFTSIYGLESCKYLEALWICETKVDKIQGLEHLSYLKRLFLYSNEIKKIEGLKFTQLTTLWLNGNKIRVLEGLDSLVNLEVLWLADNLIERVVNSLDNNLKLRELNLSNNKIGYLNDLLNLLRLPNLKHFYLSDDVHGQNPVCDLWYYNTFVLFHFKQLETLDGTPVTAEALSNAQSLYMNKLMYYNMRIKTMKRNTTARIQEALRIKQTHTAVVYSQMAKLVREQRAMQKQLDENKYQPSPRMDTDTQKKLKLNDIKESIELRHREVKTLDRKFKQLKKRLIQTTESTIQKLMVEMNNVGNVRLESGKTTDVWFTSCQELIYSRFFPNEFKQFGIADVRVTNVYRIHNRHLRNRFEKRLAELVPPEDESYKKSMEYLFYGEDEACEGEVLRVIERGFLAPEEYERIGMPGSVELSNCVIASDVSRLKQISTSSLTPEQKSRKMNSSKFLICKVYLGKTTEIPEASVVQKPDDDLITVFKVKSNDRKQKIYYSFEHYLILPEYLVEFEYLSHGSTSKREPLTADDEKDASQRELVALINEFKVECKGLKTAETQDNASELISKQPVFFVTEDIILKQTKASQLSHIRYLNLFGCNVQKIENLSALQNLKVLVLCFNEIQKIEGLNDLQNLEELDLGYNKIKRIESNSLKGLTKLSHLDISFNQLQKVEDLNALKKCTPNLLTLNMVNNPVAETKGFRGFVLRRLESLKVLDGTAVSQTERDESSILTIKVIMEHSYTKPRFFITEKTSPRYAPTTLSTPHRDDEWWKKVVELDLSHQGIRKLQNLDKLLYVKRAWFSDNQITKIENLENNLALEELYLEENRITKIEGLNHLVNLTRLDLSKNNISKLENLDKLLNLSQLSLEDNKLQQLSGLKSLTSLMELYIANNDITDLKEIFNLKSLSKLLILDLAGNPISSQQHYRLYLLYKLQLLHLKVVDGKSVDAEETEKAREQFSGRLNIDVLEESFGGRNFQDIKDFTLSGAKIREIDTLPAHEFCKLRELVLENNLLSNIRGLSELTSLLILKLNGNRISSFEGMCAMHDRNSEDKETVRKNQPLASLQALHLGFNHVKDIGALHLHMFAMLSTLNLESNEITKVDGLEGLENLRELNLDRNKIKSVDIGNFSSLNNLKILRMEDNGLRSLSNFEPLPKLQILKLGGNRISELAELDRLFLPNIREIALNGTSVARKSHYRAHLLVKNTTLITIDDKPVLQEEREKAEEILKQPEIEQKQQIPPNKVPLKLNLMNFDDMVKNGANHQSLDWLNISPATAKKATVKSTSISKAPSALDNYLKKVRRL